MRQEQKEVWYADDGKEFDDEAECRRYEAMARLEKEVDAWLDSFVDDDGVETITPHARKLRRNTVLRWLAFDIEEHPGRYTA